ncbi:MAG: hypothetical protein NZ899_14720 [Thermoguttaceae bacterium]|nr:hypothetical protein [Thermoguttaceae bacterium]MDW8079552.1 hypothetical protein [Thermoguttaceae bacterium]
MAGAAVLGGVYATLYTAELALRQAIALGVAEQLMDEIYGSSYSEGESNPYSLTLGPGKDETASGTRALYDDVDDYHRLVCEPPVDRWGIRLGQDDGRGSFRFPGLRLDSGFVNAIRLECRVSYVRKDDFRQPVASGSASDYRAIEITASYRAADGTLRPLCQLQRLVAYIPRL